jgi:hypothetical protein
LTSLAFGALNRKVTFPSFTSGSGLQFGCVTLAQADGSCPSDAGKFVDAEAVFVVWATTVPMDKRSKERGMIVIKLGGLFMGGALL